MNKYTVTSNRIKMYKHLDKLQRIQNFQDGASEYVSPVMVHVIPTHNCQLKCVHCCFKNRGDADDMPLEMFEESMRQFAEIGVKAMEFTGGGEPTKWKYLNEALSGNTMKKGIITNGVDELKRAYEYTWVRVSLNPIDYSKDIHVPDQRATDVSFCYIWNKFSSKKIKEVGEFAAKHKIICRVAPDCIQDKELIAKDMEEISKHVEPYEYLFLSDFNIDLERRSEMCYMHMWKPCLYLDGYVYACPSTELAPENDKKVQDKFRMCHYTEIKDYYSNKIKPVKHDCSYCKYVQQGEVIEELLIETEHNDFA